MKILMLVSFIVIFLLVPVKKAEAKLLPQATGAKTIAKSAGSKNLIVSPRLRADRKALIIYFGNIQSVRSLSYTLMYTTNGQEEAAGGTISSSGNSATRELLFGTCSKDVCRYHTNISTARFEVTYTLSSGKKFLKRYRIKL